MRGRRSRVRWHQTPAPSRLDRFYRDSQTASKSTSKSGCLIQMPAHLHHLEFGLCGIEMCKGGNSIAVH